MRRKGLEPMSSNHVNVTPLIDVIMCLIIFFLLCGQFARDEAKHVSLPIADLGQEVDKQGQLLVNLVWHATPGLFRLGTPAVCGIPFSEHRFHFGCPMCADLPQERLGRVHHTVLGNADVKLGRMRQPLPERPQA